MLFSLSKKTMVLCAMIIPAVAFGQCEVTIDSNDMMRFDREVITVSANCESVTVTLTHSGRLAVNQMGHNWVLGAASDIDGIVADGIRAGLDSNYLKPADERVLAATDLIGGGEATSVTFSLNALSSTADYRFVCTFPGHATLMRGRFVIE